MAPYGSSIYFPMLVLDGQGRLAGLRLRPGNAGNNRFATPLMARLIRKLKARFARARILVRADGGFCTPRFLDAIEHLDAELSDVRFVIGLPHNSRLVGLAHAPMQEAAREALATDQTTRRFSAFRSASRNWAHNRRAVQETEHNSTQPTPTLHLTNCISPR